MIVLDFGVNKKKKILVVEDDLFQGDVLETTLSSKYDVLRAVNGVLALEKVKWNTPDVIILDIMMPEMGGYEVLKNLQTLPSAQNIPVVILTSRNFDVTTVEMFRQEPNVVSYLQKPISPDLLLFKIEEILR